MAWLNGLRTNFVFRCQRHNVDQVVVVCIGTRFGDNPVFADARNRRVKAHTGEQDFIGTFIVGYQRIDIFLVLQIDCFYFPTLFLALAVFKADSGVCFPLVVRSGKVAGYFAEFRLQIFD